jgi:hypothetical protein
MRLESAASSAIASSHGVKNYVVLQPEDKNKHVGDILRFARDNSAFSNNEEGEYIYWIVFGDQLPLVIWEVTHDWLIKNFLNSLAELAPSST